MPESQELVFNPTYMGYKTIEIHPGTSFTEDPEIDWQMSPEEKKCIVNILSVLRPDAALEIGTFKGGSLQVLNAFSKNVYSLDISSEPEKLLAHKFPAVQFRIGASYKLMHAIFDEIYQRKQQLGFILVDGEHTKKGVRGDLEAILNYPHRQPLTILIHDSFNPQCRAGIKAIDFSKYPAVTHLEIDYIQGSVFKIKGFREMWGGFALLLLDPSNQKKMHFLNNQQRRFNRTYLRSIHLVKDKLHFLTPLRPFAKKLLGKK